MGAMAKAATAKPKKRARKTPTRKPRRLTPAQKMLRSVSGWAGDDLEEVMAIVAATRTPTKF